MFFRFFAFKVIVFNLSHHILGKGQVAANEVAFVAFAGKFLPGAVHGRIDLGWCTKVIVFGKEAPRTCFGGFCSIPAHVDDIAIVIRIGVLSFFEGIVIPFEIHGANLELSNFVVGTGVPNGVVAVYHDLLIIIFNELSSKVPITPCFTQFCFNKRVSDSFGRPLFDSSRPTVLLICLANKDWSGC